MEKKEFGDRWRKWIRDFLSSSNLSVVVNGSGDLFRATRGLDKGLPYPYLFLH